MILYSIRRISDGRFYCHIDGRGTAHFNSSPTYWRKAETVWLNLGRLCSEMYKKQYGPLIDYRGEKTNFLWWRKDFKNFDAQKLAGYEVVETNVHVLGERITPALKFVLPDDLATMNLEIRA